jgi:hypothetical protein
VDRIVASKAGAPIAEVAAPIWVPAGVGDPSLT